MRNIFYFCYQCGRIEEVSGHTVLMEHKHEGLENSVRLMQFDTRRDARVYMNQLIKDRFNYGDGDKKSI